MPLDFLGIGAQRAGTSWARNNLRRHPDLWVCLEEVHFWDKLIEDVHTEWKILGYKYIFDERNKISGEITPE